MLTKHATIKSTLCILLALAGCTAAGLYVLFQTQQEKTNAFLMQVMLINTAMAQEVYYDKHGSFAAKWQEILPAIAKPSSAAVAWTPVPDKPDSYYIGFNQEKQYQVSLAPSADSLLIRARRVNGAMYRYELQYELPQLQPQCHATGVTRLFCSYLLKKFEQLDAKNLIPVPSSAKAEK